MQTFSFQGFLGCDEPRRPIGTTPIACPFCVEAKPELMGADRMKRISVAAWHKLHGFYGGIPELSRKAMLAKAFKSLNR